MVINSETNTKRLIGVPNAKVRLVIFGSRLAQPSIGWIDRGISLLGLDREAIDEIVCGKAKGADERGRIYAKTRGIPCIEFQAAWDQLGKVAGLRRNEDMAAYATHGLGFWVDGSPGTANMCCNMVALNKPVKVIKL